VKLESRIQVLVLDRLAADRDAFDEMLRGVPGPGYELVWVPPTLAAREELAQRLFDVVLLNLTALRGDPPEVFAGLRQAFQGLPVIVLTEEDDEDTGLVAMRGGAQDCLVKGEFNGRWLSRIIRYAIERKRTEVALQQSEEFFRLISENVTDLIAVIDRDGRRVYNSRSYRSTFGEGGQLDGTDSFSEIHPEDKETIQHLFRETLTTGIGRRAEYRIQLADGSVRHIESQGSVIRDQQGEPSKVVVVSRDITERRQAMKTLGQTLAELQQVHDGLKAAQHQLVQSEKLEAVSTFAAGIAHEVKNPLQTILLGLDFLRDGLESPNPNVALVLREMETAARRADAVIQGLLESVSYGKHDIAPHDFNAIVVQSLRAVEAELADRKIHLTQALAPALPPLALDAKKVRHVLIKLFLGTIEALNRGGNIWVRTFLQSGPGASGPVPAAASDKDGVEFVGVEVQDDRATSSDGIQGAAVADAPDTSGLPSKAFELTIIRKVVELFGGILEANDGKDGRSRVTIRFKRTRVANQHLDNP
jgi:PAS domain S-box-containing protein